MILYFVRIILISSPGFPVVKVGKSLAVTISTSRFESVTKKPSFNSP